MLSRIATVPFLLLLTALSAAADPAAICRANNRDFPQSCPCIVERAQAAGLTGPVLDRLLANDTAGLDIALFQQYGAIFVQCIQEAVMAGVPAKGGAAPGAPAVPTLPVFPVPSTEAPATAPGAATVPALAALGDHPAAAGIKRLPQDVPGHWGPLAFGGAGFGAVQAGVLHESGAGLMLSCGAGRDMALIAGPFDLPPGHVPGSLTVTGGGGFAQDYTFSVIEGRYVAAPIFGLAVERLQSGNEAILRLADPAIELRFGLSGSSKAIRDLRGAYDCATWRNGARPAWQPMALWSYLVDTVWQQGEIRLDGPLGLPAARAGADEMMFADLSLVCDGRLAVGGLPSQRMGGTYAITLDPVFEGMIPLPPDRQPRRFDLRLDPVAGQLAGPVPAGLAEAMAAAETLQIEGPAEHEPGDAYSMRYRLTGFAEAAAGLACPAAPEPRGLAPKTDLTGAGLVWQPFDGPGPGGPERGAFLRPEGVSQITVDCAGVPYFDGGAFGLIGDQRLLLELDGDPARALEVVYGNYRASLSPSGSPALDAFAAGIPAARTLRVTALENPAHDILYPLDGLRAALTGAGHTG